MIEQRASEGRKKICQQICERGNTAPEFVKSAIQLMHPQTGSSVARHLQDAPCPHPVLSDTGHAAEPHPAAEFHRDYNQPGNFRTYVHQTWGCTGPGIIRTESDRSDHIQDTKSKPVKRRFSEEITQRQRAHMYINLFSSAQIVSAISRFQKRKSSDFAETHLFPVQGNGQLWSI